MVGSWYDGCPAAAGGVGFLLWLLFLCSASSLFASSGVGRDGNGWRFLPGCGELVKQIANYDFPQVDIIFDCKVLTIALLLRVADRKVYAVNFIGAVSELRRIHLLTLRYRTKSTSESSDNEKTDELPDGKIVTVSVERCRGAAP